MARQRVYLIAAVMVVACGVYAAFAGPLTSNTTPTKQFARLVVAHELQRAHAVLGGEDFLNLIPDFVGAELNSELADRTWNVRFLRSGREPTNSGRTTGHQLMADKPDALESAAMAAIRDGDKEVWQEMSSGTLRLVMSVSATDTCIKCHAHDGESKPFAFASVTFSSKQR